MILRIACFVGVAAFATSFANCQPLQVRAGVNYSTIVDGGDLKFHPGFYAGIQKDLMLSRGDITFQPGIFYSLQTTQLPDYERFSFHYVQVPMLFNLKIADHGGLLLGPQMGLLVHARSRFLNGDSDPEPITTRYSSIALSLGVAPYVTIDHHLKMELRGMYDLLGSGRSSGGSHMLLLQFGFVYTITKKEAE